MIFRDNSKKDFPLLRNSKIIYLDNAATTQKPELVISALKEFYEKHNANAHRGLYKLSIDATEILDNARQTVADFIGSEKNEIIFTKSATESINLLANSIGENIGRWENIVVTEMEHHSNFVPWQQLCIKTQAKFIVVPYDKEKHELEEITEYIDKRTHILAITHMSNVTGKILDIKNIIKKVREKNEKTIIILDSTQAIAHTDINVKELDADFIVFSAHKIYGPTGVGVIYGKKELLQKITPFLYGGNMILEVKKEKSKWAELPEKFEAGTIDVAGINAFAEALRYLNMKGSEKIFQKEKELKEYALQKLREAEHVNVIAHNNENYGPVISFNVTDIHPHDLAEICSRNNICIRAGHHCAQPLMHALDVTATSRISLSFYNTEKEIDELITTIKKARKIING